MTQEQQQLQQLKNYARKLFGEGDLICAQCGAHAWYVYDMRGNVTTRTQCCTEGCQCRTVIKQPGWKDAVRELLYQKT